VSADQIDLDRELFDSLSDKLSDAVGTRRNSTPLGIPSDDLFQVFTTHGPASFASTPRQRGRPAYSPVCWRITMVHMYPVETKQRLYRAIVERFADAGVRAGGPFLISVVENGYEDWYAGSASDEKTTPEKEEPPGHEQK
jgi:hypothetical protein